MWPSADRVTVGQTRPGHMIVVTSAMSAWKGVERSSSTETQMDINSGRIVLKRRDILTVIANPLYAYKQRERISPLAYAVLVTCVHGPCYVWDVDITGVWINA